MILIQGKRHDLGGGFFINRLLPDRTKRMVGPFIFLDHMGPLTIQPNQNTDVRPHPHIGLSTLTYLFEGHMVHRDSLGVIADIAPGEVNWMTAGKGISHSERSLESEQSKVRTMHGLQFWVALPDDSEDCDPSFQHYEKSVIPRFEDADKSICVIAGDAFGLKSPVKTTSPLIFAEIKTKNDFDLNLKIEGFELALYVIKGSAQIENQNLLEPENKKQIIAEIQMMVYENGGAAHAQIKAGSHVVIIGGKPFPNQKFIWWNLVSSSKEKIEKAKKDWAAGTFPKVPGETEFIPLPLS